MNAQETNASRAPGQAVSRAEQSPVQEKIELGNQELRK
jgi:hypothetical protein